MDVEILDAQVDADKLRTVKLESALRKFAVTVAGRSLDLSIVTNPHMRPYGNPPAWSDGSSINVFHDTARPIMEVDSLVRLKGLTIHELGHVIFTPRDRTELIKQVVSERMYTSFNLLEDNRIDNLMVARLSGVAPWLLHAVFTEFFSTDDGHEFLMPLLHGRKYVPQQIRDLAASVYHNQSQVAEIQSIIDEYITLNLARKPEQVRALALIRQFHNLIDSKQDLTQHSRDMVAAPAKNGGGDMAGAREQQDALNRANKIKPAKQPTDAQADDGKSDKQKLSDQIAKAQDAVNNDILNDIKNMVKGMRSGAGNGNADGRVKKSEGIFLRPVNSQTQLQTRNFARVLQELKSLYDPSWVAHQSSGRLNAREFLMGASLDESFDMWDEGRIDASDIECVILLDISGSMYPVLDEAYDAMWGIKRALDSINASCTVVTFGDYSRVLYEADSRATIQSRRSWDGAGNTNPLRGVRYARDLLLNSSRAVKLFVAITDGWWSDKEQSDAAIAELRTSGVLTGMVFLEPRLEQMKEHHPDWQLRVDAHNCEVVKVISNPHDITDFARQLVQRQQQLVLKS